MKTLLLYVLAGLGWSTPVLSAVPREFYQIKVYYYDTKAQEQRLDQYLKEAYLPALHRAGYKHVGVFKPIATDTVNKNRIYVWVPVKSFEQTQKLHSVLEKDKQYQATGTDYLNTAYSSPAYNRIETIFLEAFPLAPQYKTPKLSGPKTERVYELRSYEGHTEKISANKIDMFNEGGEIPLFERLNFNAVFYGTVLFGKRMPNLMYMTTFENRKDRDQHWDTFRTDSEWLKLKELPQYQNNVSRNEQILLNPTEYSDI